MNKQEDVEEALGDPKTMEELEDWVSKGRDLNSLISKYEAICNLNDRQTEAWSILGHCFLLKKDFKRSISAYQKALQHTTAGKAQLWLNIGVAYFTSEDLSTAESAFLTALRCDPDSSLKVEILRKLGTTNKLSQEFSKSLYHLKTALEIDGVANELRSAILSEMGQVYDKLAVNNSLQTHESNFKVLQYIGWHFLRCGKPQDAIHYLQKALVLSEENSLDSGDIHYLMGRCYFALDRKGDSQTSLQKAIYKNPDSYVYWCSIGILYALSTQAQDAFECFVKASNVNPKCSIVWFNLAVLYEHCKQHKEAISAYQRAYALDSSNNLALERKNKLQGGEYGNIPKFEHPCFEISSSSFAIKPPEITLEVPEERTLLPQEGTMHGPIPNVFNLQNKGFIPAVSPYQMMFLNQVDTQSQRNVSFQTNPVVTQWLYQMRMQQASDSRENEAAEALAAMGSDMPKRRKPEHRPSEGLRKKKK